MSFIEKISQQKRKKDYNFEQPKVETKNFV